MKIRWYFSSSSELFRSNPCLFLSFSSLWQVFYTQVFLGFVDLLCAFAQILHGIRARSAVACSELQEKGRTRVWRIRSGVFSEKTGGSLNFGADWGQTDLTDGFRRRQNPHFDIKFVRFGQRWSGRQKHFAVQGRMVSARYPRHCKIKKKIIIFFLKSGIFYHNSLKKLPVVTATAGG